MSLDLATAYTRSGLDQTPANDALQTTALNVAIAVVENYLDRKFMYGSSAESFYYTHFRNYYLERYPIESISYVSPSGKFKIHHSLGKVEYPNFVCKDEVRFEYTGGYRVLPADLEEGIWRVFDDTLGGMGIGGGSASSSDISSVTIPDVGTVRYDTSSSSAGGDGATGNGAIDLTTAALIDSYKRIFC